MAASTKPDLASGIPPAQPEGQVRSWPSNGSPDDSSPSSVQNPSTLDSAGSGTPPLDALQALLAFSVLHEQVRRKKSEASEFDTGEQFVLDEVLQLVAERALTITGSDGLAIALAENDEIVLRAAAGAVRPDIGARIDRDSGFSGACFREAHIVHCNDTETDARVNREACQSLGARSIVAVPLCGRQRVIGLLEAFSARPFAFSVQDVRNLSLLAELVVGALRPEDEDRFAASAQMAASKLGVAPAYEAVQNEAAAIRVSGSEESHESLARRAPEELEVETETGNSAADRLRWGVLLLVVIVAIASAAGFWWKRRSPHRSVTATHSETALKPAVTARDTADVASPVPAAVIRATPPPGVTSKDSPAKSSPDLSSELPRVTAIERSSSADSTTVVVYLEEQVQYEEHRLAGPDRVYFDLPGTHLAPGLTGKTIAVDDAFLKRVRIAQPQDGVTRVVLELTRAAILTEPKVSLESNPFRLVIEIRKRDPENKGGEHAAPAPAREKNTEKNSVATAPVRLPPPSSGATTPRLRIAVDAGHGGWDLGTIGRGGLVEKDLVLAIAQRLGKLLEDRLRAEVILIRAGDSYIPLDQRAEIANQAQAGLLISIHANYSQRPSARGVETYYARSFTAPVSQERSNQAKSKGLPAALSPADPQERVEQSRRLASSVQRSLCSALSLENPGLPDRGTREAGFAVLTESAMPGVLAEVSFVSSPADEQKLRTDVYRDQIAEALYQGIAQYAAATRVLRVASAHR